MTLLFADGFEDGALAWLFTNMGTVTGRSGNGLTNTGASGTATTSFSATTGPIVLGCAVKTTSVACRLLQVMGAAGGATVFSLDRGIGGEVTLTGGASTSLTGTTVSATGVVPANAWSYVEVKFVIHATTGYVIVRVNGVTVINATGDTLATGAPTADSIRLGGNGVTGSYIFDDVYLCDANGSVNNDFLGDLTVEHLRPASDDTAQFVGSDSNSTDNWALVDEAGTYNGSDYVGSSTIGQRDLYVPGASARPGGSAVHGVIVAAIAMKSDTGTRTVKLNVREGAPLYGAEQRITIANAPSSAAPNDTALGVRMTFVSAGRVTKIRYKRLAASGATQEFRVWNSSGVQVGSTVNQSDVGDGTFEFTLPTPLIVAAGSTYTFAIGSAGATPRNGSGAQAVTNTTDCTFVGYFWANTRAAFPNDGSFLGTPYVEPTFEPVSTANIRQSTELGLPTSFGELTAVFERKGDGSQFTVADVNALRIGMEVAS